MAQQKHTINHLREAFAAYYTIEGFINPATAKAKAITETKRAAALWGMDEKELDWDYITKTGE